MNKDTLGMVLSVSCIAHCLLLPVLAIFFSSLAPFAENEMLHKGLFALTLLISLPVFFKTESKNIKLTGLAGIVFMALALFFHVELLEKGLTTVGAILVSAAHATRMIAHKKSQP